MAHFSYYGRDAKQLPVEGKLEASNKSAAAGWLLQNAIQPIHIEEIEPVAEVATVLGRLWGRDRVTPVELMMFTRQMYTLTKAGVPIIRAFRSLEKSAESKLLRRLYMELASTLESGVELSQAMARREDVFDNFYVSMVRVGESTGELERVFLSLFKHLEFQKYIREQVKSALRYPTFVVLAMIAAIIIINIFVIPAFAKVFTSLHAELPIMTRILLGMSRFFLDWWSVILLTTGAALMGWRFFVKSAAGSLWWDRIKLGLPVVGELIQKGILAQATRSLALVFDSGVPVVQGLTLSAKVVDNAYVSKALGLMRHQVERGDSLLAASQRAGVFTPLVLQMIMVGEESGATSEMLHEVSQMYQSDLEYGLKNLSQKIEPILLIAMGAMVLVLALGVFMPMWDLGKAALHHG